MRDPRSAIAPPVTRLLSLVAIACLILLTLVDRGATRAYSTPWLLLLWLAPAATLLALAARAFSTEPLALPSKPWTLTAAASAATLVLSSLLSLYRGPSLLVAFVPLGALAAFFLLHDHLAANPHAHARTLLVRLAQFLAVVAILSVALWLLDLFNPAQTTPLLSRLNARNPHPLGHSNYTAGLAVLSLPLFLGLALSSTARARLAWFAATALSLLMLFSSGSRAGLVALAALTVLGLFYARLSRKQLLLAATLGALLLAAVVLAHPRTRAALFADENSPASLSESDRQRASMTAAGLRFGADRPLLGWGPGTTPLVFPRYRAAVDGGVENVLQLHSTPLQLWAETGALGLLCGLSFAVLLLLALVRLRPAPRALPSPAALAGVALAGYLVFSVFDFQLDVPVFAFALAALAALVASPSPARLARESQLNLTALATLSVGLVVCFGSGDPAALLNTRALELAADSTKKVDAYQLFKASLAHNPDQEIAHFNLGWLLLVSDPARAEQHFRAAARLVPDKGGLYFGLALARMNQGRADDPFIPHALALECLNDPLFLTSPWWRQPSFAEQRLATFAQLHALGRIAAERLEARADPRAETARYIVALAAWLDDLGPATAAASHTDSAPRIQFFDANPAPPDFASASVKAYRRVREGYPVLMRNLDLPAPVDLFDVQENALAADVLSFLFPPKGWLPSPLLLELLEHEPPSS